MAKGFGAGAAWLMNLANTLGIPLGAKYKKYTNKNSSPKETLPDQIAVIAEITRDDICLTESPFFYNSERLRLGAHLKSRLDIFQKCLNDIARSVAFDLLVDGHSAYKLREVDKEYFFEPLIAECEFYLKDNKVITVVNGKVLDDLLLFINYEKRDLEPYEFEGKPTLKINPVGFQTRYTKDLLDKLQAAEESIARLRAQTRYIRFASVEVGLNKGDQQQEIVDDISEGLNANSESLPQSEVFNDNIPVFPTRKGIGKPVIEEYAPNTDLGKLTDIEYYQTQLALYTRFPKSYSDFSTNLSATALSMIRGDIRYERIISAVRNLMERTTNDFLRNVEVVQKAKVTWIMKSIPSSEDSDVIDTMSEIVQLLNSILDTISDGENELVAKQKVNLLLKLFDTVRETAIVSEIKKELHILVSLMFSPEEPEDVFESEFEDFNSDSPRHSLKIESEPDSDDEVEEESEEPEE